jgi:CheY-like chemotaxis protein
MARAMPPREITVLHVDDDPNDTTLLQAAARRAGASFVLFNVEDGEQAIAYLSGCGQFSDRDTYPLPALIVLDLKMPRTTGFEILKWVREHHELGDLPVLVLSGSDVHEDIRQAYGSGASSYVIKPLGFEALVSLAQSIDAVWLKSASIQASRAPARL